MSNEQDDYIQIKNLNKLTQVKNNHLLLIDDVNAGCNAITFENFLTTAKDKTFKGEGLNYFKEVIKGTIATELLQNEKFINQVYDQVLKKFLNDDSSSISSTYSKVKDRIGSGLSTYSLSKDDYFVTSRYSSLQKAQIPEYLTGIPSGFNSARESTSSSSIYASSFKNQAYRIDMTTPKVNQEITLVCYSSDNDKPIYLDIYVDVSIEAYSIIKKYVYLKYSGESHKSIVYERGGSNMTLNDYSPLFRSWYMQKRLYKSGSYIPVFVKL